MSAASLEAAASIETKASWAVALTAVGIAAESFGAPLVAVVALKPIAAELAAPREVPAAAYSLAWFGTAVGGLLMGHIAERIGVRWTVICGALMIGAGLALASTGGRIALLLGHGLFMGVLGNGGINAPLYIYVARWFDRRRGTALALISSGQAVAGAIWPPGFAWGIAAIGWRHTMLVFAAIEIALIVPAALWMFGPPPEAHAAEGPVAGPAVGDRVLGLKAGTVLGFLMAAAFCCCVPMAMPQGHLVALCSDYGIPASHGAAMLSLLLGSAFISRQFWGLVADKVGGLRTVLYGSACQFAAMVGFLLTQSEAGLIAVAAVFGFGFSGIIPAYVLAVRELFPAAEASWRVPSVLLCSGSGMAAGGWLAGIIYDHFGFYGAAFATGLAFNLVNLVLVGALVVRQHWRHAEPHHPLGTTWSMTDAQ